MHKSFIKKMTERIAFTIRETQMFINQSINQSVNQSINQSITTLMLPEREN